MNLQKFNKLPYAVKVKLMENCPLLRVCKLPAGNQFLPTPLKLGEMVVNQRVPQQGFKGRFFVKVKHSGAVSSFDYQYFELPLKRNK